MQSKNLGQSTLTAPPIIFGGNVFGWTVDRAASTLCLLEQADYMECLTRDKLKRRVAAKLVEAKRLADEAKNPSAGGAAHGGH